LGGETVLVGVRIGHILGISELGHRLAAVHVGLEDGLQLKKLAAIGSWLVVQPALVATGRTRPPVSRVAHCRTLKGLFATFSLTFIHNPNIFLNHKH
jgi:hypothetical protein